jgi:tubulin-specific chaperone A
MATPDLLKQLEVKKNVIARTMKDLQLYRQEELDERAKVDKLKANNADPYDIKYAESILQEAVAMVPDAVQRPRAAHRDLASFLDSNAAEISGDQLTESTNLIQTAVTMVDA